MVDGLTRAIGRFVPLQAGLFFALLWLAAVYGLEATARNLAYRASPRALTLRYWYGWPFLGRLIGAGLAIGWLFAALGAGVYVSSDVGLGHVTPVELLSDDPSVRQWLLLSGQFCGLLLLLWGSYWRSARDMPFTPRFAPLSIAVEVLGEQAILAILRASLVPRVGTYWAVWAAVSVKMALMLAAPHLRRRLRSSERWRVYLTWALDWQSAALFVLYRNLILTTLSRLVAALLVQALSALVTRRAQRRREADAELTADRALGSGQ